MGIKEIINIKQWSLLETMIAMYLMVSGWTLSPIPVYLWWAVLMDMVAFKRYHFNPKRMFPQYRVLFWFIMVHQFLWIFIVNGISSTYFNAWLSMVITMGSVFFVAPVLNYEKLKAPIFFLTIVSILGIIYQLLSLSRGLPIGQLYVPPFSSSQDLSNIELLDYFRPSSFFSEPAAYCQYMLVPLYITLMDEKYFGSFIIILTMLLSTSTSGVVLSFMMLGVYIFTQKVSLKLKILVVVGAICVGIALVKSDMFEATMDKVERTELSENERTSIGFTLLPQLDSQDLLFGISYANISDMYNAGKLKVDTFTWIGKNGKTVVFVPTFWNMLFIFGIFGLIIYLSVYYHLIRQTRLLLPYFIVVIAKMFSDPTGIGATHLFEICFMMSFIRWIQNNETKLQMK